jgi:hypothetical protein
MRVAFSLVCACAYVVLVADARLLTADVGSTVYHTGSTNKHAEKATPHSDYSPHVTQIGGFDIILSSSLAASVETKVDSTILVKDGVIVAEHKNTKEEHNSGAKMHGHKIASIQNSDGKSTHTRAKANVDGRGRYRWVGALIAGIGVMVMAVVALFADTVKQRLAQGSNEAGTAWKPRDLAAEVSGSVTTMPVVPTRSGLYVSTPL